MCYHKSLLSTYEALAAEYAASFSSIESELDQYKNSFEELMLRDETKQPYSKLETAEIRAFQKTIESIKENSYVRYHENGFDYSATPIITLDDPNNFHLFRWGLIHFYMKDFETASSVSCIE